MEVAKYVTTIQQRLEMVKDCSRDWEEMKKERYKGQFDKKAKFQTKFQSGGELVMVRLRGWDPN